MGRKMTSEEERAFFTKRFVKLFDEWKTKTGKTQSEFCRIYGIGEETVIAWKHGKRFPNEATLEKICDAFSVKRYVFDRDYELITYLENSLAGALKAVRQIRQRVEVGKWGR